MKQDIKRVARTKGGCGCAIAVLVAFLGALGFVGYKFILPWWNKQPPPASGKELRVHVLDVGQGDSILIVAPEGKTVLVDAGDEKNGKKVVEALKAQGVQQLDFLIATHTHPDHIGGVGEVLASVKVGTVLHNDYPPPEAVAKEEAAAAAAGKSGDKKQGKKQAAPPPPKNAGRQGKGSELPTIKAYNSFKGAIEQTGTKFEKAEPEREIDLGGGARIIILAPIPPLFTKEKIAASRKGNESNANSIVMRLEYGEFSMLLTGDAEEQTEERLVQKETNLAATILKVGHHGSRYATSESFLKRVFRADDGQAKAAIISMSEFNRYGHPNQDVLNRLKAAGVKQLYRTDLQGEITIVTTGKVKDGKLYEIKAAKETKSDVWLGREGEKNDSTSSGFITYGDYGPPPRQRKK